MTVDHDIDRYAYAPEPVARDTLSEERVLLAAALVYPETLTDAVLDLPAEHLSSARHTELWAHLRDRALAGEPADVPAVAEHFHGMPGMGDLIAKLAVDGLTRPPAQMSTLAAHVSAGHRARVTERALQAAWQRLAAGDVDAALEAMHAVDPTAGQVGLAVTLSEAWAEALSDAESGRNGVIPTPWPTLNSEYLSGGWRGGEVYFLAGAPGTGKTAAMQVIADHCARTGHTTLVFSLEMARTDLARRTMSTAGRIAMPEVMRPDLRMRRESYDAAGAALADIGDRLLIVDQPGLTSTQVREQARLYVRRHGVSVILLDYAQLVKATDPRLSERERIEHVCEELKLLARELHVPVVALAQPNRNAAMQGRRLAMTDLHGSGAMDRVAAMIILLNRVEDEPSIPATCVDFDIDKNRYGRTGQIRMLADLAHQRFEEL